jgi:prepilin-type processing-associated H-X9-DG protein
MAEGKPYGPDKQGMSWAYQILPFIEEGNVQSQNDTLQIQGSPVAIYNCPSRRPPTRYESHFFGSAYLMDYASAQPGTQLSATITTMVDPVRDGEIHQRMYTVFWVSRAGGWNGSPPPNNGVYDGVIVRSSWRFNPRPASDDTQSNVPGEFASGVPSPVRVAQVTDGTSTTMMIGEKWIDAREYGGGGPSDDRGWLDGWDPDTVRLTCTPPSPDSTFPPLMANSAAMGLDNQAYLFGSAHYGGFNATFADGSVRSITYEIESYVLNSIGTRNGTALNETTLTDGVQ